MSEGRGASTAFGLHHPETLPVSVGAPTYEAIPGEMRERPQWVVWRYERRPGDAKPTKVPYQVEHPSRGAKADDPATWSTFQRALSVVRQPRGFDGIGYEFWREDPYVGLDLDEITNQVLRHVAVLDSYTERSVSRRGLHVVVKGDIPDRFLSVGRDGLQQDGRRSGTFEVYRARHFFVATGDHVSGTRRTIEFRQDELEQVLDHYLKPVQREEQPALPVRPLSLSDREIVDKMLSARNAAKAERLWRGDWEGAGYSSHSEADLALCSILAYWTGRDAPRVDALFRQSGLMRDKWNRPEIRDWTIGRALSTRHIYTPAWKAKPWT